MCRVLQGPVTLASTTFQSGGKGKLVLLRFLPFARLRPLPFAKQMAEVRKTDGLPLGAVEAVPVVEIQGIAFHVHAGRTGSPLMLAGEATQPERKPGSMLNETHAPLGGDDLHMRAPIPHQGEGHLVALTDLEVLLELVLEHEPCARPPPRTVAGRLHFVKNPLPCPPPLRGRGSPPPPEESGRG